MNHRYSKTCNFTISARLYNTSRNCRCNFKGPFIKQNKSGMYASHRYPVNICLTICGGEICFFLAKKNQAVKLEWTEYGLLEIMSIFNSFYLKRKDFYIVLLKIKHDWTSWLVVKIELIDADIELNDLV